MADVTAGGGERIKVLWLTKGLGPGGAERLLLSFAQKGDHERFDFHAAYLLPWKDHLVARWKPPASPSTAWTAAGRGTCGGCGASGG